MQDQNTVPAELSLSTICFLNSILRIGHQDNLVLIYIDKTIK